MPSPNTHLEAERLVAYASTELPPREMSAADLHLLECNECRERLHQLQSSLEQYARYHEEWKRKMPPPPGPWAPLALGNSAPRHAARWWWAAAAAAVAALAIFVPVLRPPSVSAAELLEKAMTRERQSGPPPKRKLRVKMQNLLYTRPAIGSDRSPALAGLRKRFEDARFDWENPLSAEAFHSWRSRLPQKEDSVTVLSGAEQQYRISTRTKTGALEEVALTLRASDFRAVQNVLRFRDSVTVELSEDPAMIASAPAPETHSAAAPAEAAPPPQATSELDVLAALHGIGADLGEPVEVERSGATLTVTATGLDEGRQQEYREALSDLPGVTVRFEGRAGRVDAVESDLVEFSEAVLARAHALASLAERYPPAKERALPPREKAILEGIVRDHVEGLLGAGQELPVRLGHGATGEFVPCSIWQECAAPVLGAAQAFDRAVAQAFAEGGSRKPAGASGTALLLRLASLRGLKR
ncbi:MAG: hypothetical protein SFV54_02335 [Bryobacteraceae bacterium]|nr:hypothetical protein [Bryobacteraceae bacterium]